MKLFYLGCDSCSTLGLYTIFPVKNNRTEKINHEQRLTATMDLKDTGNQIQRTLKYMPYTKRTILLTYLHNLLHHITSQSRNTNTANMI